MTDRIAELAKQAADNITTKATPAHRRAGHYDEYNRVYREVYTALLLLHHEMTEKEECPA